MDETAQGIDPRQVRGLKQLRHLLPLPPRGVGCARDAAGNRELHFDEYVTLVLPYLFDPMLDSVRLLQNAGAVEMVRQKIFNIESGFYPTAKAA